MPIRSTLAPKIAPLKFEQVWLGKLGAWRAEVLVRCLGFMLYLTCLGHWGKNSLQTYLERFPASSLLLGLCGFALMVAGPRLILLLPATVAGADFLWLVLQGRAGSSLRQQAAEYPMLMLIPAVLSVLAMVLFLTRRKEENGWQRLTAEFERHTVLVFRWAALTTLFFAGFHKLNADFFTSAVSCEQIVKQYAIRNWSLPGLEFIFKQTSPAFVILVESALPILLLLFCRRLGILTVVLFYGGIALTDALVVTLCIIFPALAFLEEEDWKTLKAGWQKPALAWGVLLLAWLPFSAAYYQGPRPWLQPALYQSVLLLIFTLVAWLIGRDLQQAWQQKSTGENPGLLRQGLAALGWSRPALLSKTLPGGLIILAWSALLILNGFSPYLGLKFNYSFAMLSNLRVDDARWNHLLMPKWVRLTAHDGYIHVLLAETQTASADILTALKEKQSRRLKTGLFSPQAFHDTLSQLRENRDGTQVKLLVEYKGKAFDYVGPVAEPGFADFQARLPTPNGHWLHDYLAEEGPMGCKH